MNNGLLVARKDLRPAGPGPTTGVTPSGLRSLPAVDRSYMLVRSALYLGARGGAVGTGGPLVRSGSVRP
jgi:hypothetical protein